jgi:hypothetical protein
LADVIEDPQQAPNNAKGEQDKSQHLQLHGS